MQKVKRKNSQPRPNPFSAIGRFIWMLTTGITQGLWWLVTQVFNGITYAIKHTAKFVWAGVQHGARGLWWLAKRPYYLLHYLLNGHVPEFETKREREVFWRIKRHYRRRKLLFINVFFFGVWLFIASNILLGGYNAWQRELARVELGYAETYERFFYNDLRTLTIITGIYIIILIAHMIFNKMSNTEDEVIGQALDEARQEVQSLPDTRHLEDYDYDDAYYDYYEDSKLKRSTS
ncbi:MAG: hypothetical protein AAF846_29585 [Chloroflexota bacterium]